MKEKILSYIKVMAGISLFWILYFFIGMNLFILPATAIHNKWEIITMVTKRLSEVFISVSFLVSFVWIYLTERERRGMRSVSV
jgi:hypothetical protein